MENFTAHEAYVMLGEMYVEKRRLESRLEITTEQLEQCRVDLTEARREIEQEKPITIPEDS